MNREFEMINLSAEQFKDEFWKKMNKYHSKSYPL